MTLLMMDMTFVVTERMIGILSVDDEGDPDDECFTAGVQPASV